MRVIPTAIVSILVLGVALAALSPAGASAATSTTESAASRAADGLQSRASFDRWICGPISRRGEHTSGIFGRRSTINYNLCAYRSSRSNQLSFNAAATQYPGSVSFHYVYQQISVRKRIASHPGYVGRCDASGIPTSARIPFFGGGSVAVAEFFRCRGDVQLGYRGDYEVVGTLCYDVRDDGNGGRCLTSSIPYI